MLQKTERSPVSGTIRDKKPAKGKIALITSGVLVVVGGLIALLLFVILPAAGVGVPGVTSPLNANVQNNQVAFIATGGCANFNSKKDAFLSELAFIAALPASSITLSKAEQGTDGKCYIFVNIRASKASFDSAVAAFEKAMQNPSSSDLDDDYYVVDFESDTSNISFTPVGSGGTTAPTTAPTAAPTTAPTTAPVTTNPPADQNLKLYLNCGSNTAYTYEGKLFQIDYSTLPEVQGGTKFIVKTGLTGNNLIDTSRFFAFMAPGDGYHLSLGNGNFNVTAYFAETTTTITPGKRTFQVLLEGQSAWGVVDPLVLAGDYFKLATRSKVVTVTDGTLDLTFIKGAQNPVINALEIVATA